MNRLVWSFAAYKRKMQISEAPLFAFVEGFTDRYFYSRIADSECQPLDLLHCIVTGEELAEGAGGGKNILISFFEYLEQENAVTNMFEGKTTTSVFFLDKDVDEFTGNIMRDSEHVIYTETYERESYLFCHGNISQAASGAAALDVNSVRTALGDYREWRRQAAESWKSWVKLCLFAQLHGPTSTTYYSRPTSQINDEAYGPVDPDRYESFRSALQDPRIADQQFDDLFGQLSDRVDAIYNNGQFDQVFKGTWYFGFLENDLRRIAGGAHFNNRQLRRSLQSALEQTLDFNEPWAHHFRTPISQVLARLKGR